MSIVILYPSAVYQDKHSLLKSRMFVSRDQWPWLSSTISFGSHIVLQFSFCVTTKFVGHQIQKFFETGQASLQKNNETMFLQPILATQATQIYVVHAIIGDRRCFFSQDTSPSPLFSPKEPGTRVLRFELRLQTRGKHRLSIHISHSNQHVQCDILTVNIKGSPNPMILRPRIVDLFYKDWEKCHACVCMGQGRS